MLRAMLDGAMWREAEVRAALAAAREAQSRAERCVWPGLLPVASAALRLITISVLCRCGGARGFAVVLTRDCSVRRVLRRSLQEEAKRNAALEAARARDLRQLASAEGAAAAAAAGASRLRRAVAAQLQHGSLLLPLHDELLRPQQPYFSPFH